MTCVRFLIFGGLFVCCLPASEGKIVSLAKDTSVTFLPGSNGSLTWKVDDVDASSFAFRAWFFTRTGGNREQLATLGGPNAGVLQIRQSSLSGVEIKRPATLLLKNVNQSFDGVYLFELITTSRVENRVRVFIAKKPNVTLNCSGPVTLNEGDDFTCVGRGLGGNPPANVTWHKNDVKIGGEATENKTLPLKNVDESDSGNYTFFAQSYPDPMYEDRKTIVVLVHFKPKETSIKFSQNPAVLGASVTVICQSRGFPQLSYNITLNGTTISAERTYTIAMAKWNDTGIYNCIATNTLGSNSASEFLNVTTVSVPTESKSGEAVWFIVVMSLLGVVIIGILLSYIVWRSCRKSRSSKHQSNPEPQTTEVDPTYQGLDLNKMSKEDNYQSLTGNYAASNDVGNGDESTYTELKKIRDVENQYQSLQ